MLIEKSKKPTEEWLRWVGMSNFYVTHFPPQERGGLNTGRMQVVTMLTWAPKQDVTWGAPWAYLSCAPGTVWVVSVKTGAMTTGQQFWPEGWTWAEVTKALSQ